MSERPPLPPFNRESAIQKVRLAEDGWNSRDPERVALAYTVDSITTLARKAGVAEDVIRDALFPYPVPPAREEPTKASPWIPMSEPPTKESKIVVASKYGTIDTAKIVDGFLINDNWHCDVPIDDGSFTYWMPTPPLPGETP